MRARKQRSRPDSTRPPSIVGSVAISPPGSSSVLLSVDPNALVTNLIGRPLIYDGKQLTNVFGIVVSSGDGAVKVHREFCRRLAGNKDFCRVLEVVS